MCRLHQCFRIALVCTGAVGREGVCGDDLQKKNVLKAMACFVTVCRNGNQSHLFSCLQLDYHCDDFFAPLLTGVSENVGVFCWYFVTRLVLYDQTLCLLALKRSQELELWCYGGAYPVLLCYHFTTEQLFDVPVLHTCKRLKGGSVTEINV